MAQFRCEATRDVRTGKFFVELYYPDTSAQPIAVTKPRFNSLDEAEQQTVLWFKQWFEKLNYSER